MGRLPIVNFNEVADNFTHRLQDETARVEDELTKPESLEALLRCFVTAKANSFENLLDPLLKIFRISTSIAIGMAKSQFFKRITDKLSHAKAVVRLNLLRLLRAVCDAHPNRAMLVERYGIYAMVSKLSKEDGAVLVRELAREIMPSLAPALKPASSTGGSGSYHHHHHRPARSSGSGSSGSETPGKAGKIGMIAPKVRRAASESLSSSPGNSSSLGMGNIRLASRTRLAHADTSMTGASQSSHSSGRSQTSLRHRIDDVFWQPPNQR